MRRLTLNDAWRLCLQQRRWIVKQIINGSTLGVIKLKEQWLNDHDFDDVMDDCFFCEYNRQGTGEGYCNRCPARKVDKSFSCCNNGYSHERHPLKFYAKLVELNKKRKE